MLPEYTRQGTWRLVALCILLCYPIMAVKWIPFGGGARYLNILAASVSFMLLWQAPRHDIGKLLGAALRCGLPFLPFVLVWVFAQLWHGYDPTDLNPLTRLLWCALLFIGARLAGITYRHLAIAAGLGAAVYCGVALYEVYGLGRFRASGGGYENRFGQFAIWVASLCFLHAVNDKAKAQSSAFSVLLVLAGMLGVVATLLSGSRGTLAALVVVGIILVKASQWRRGVLAGFAILFAAAAFFLPDNPMYGRLESIFREILGYFSETGATQTSIGLRLELFRIAYLTLLDHPVIGPGYTSLRQLYETHPAFGIPSEWMLAIPGFHSDWAQTIGIGGGLLMLAYFATCIWMWLAARGNVYQLAFLGFSIVFGVSEIFFTNKIGLSLLMVSWALYAAAEQNKDPGK